MSTKILVCGPFNADLVEGSSDKIQHCGGYLVLHLLVEMINNLGENAIYVGVDDHERLAPFRERIKKGQMVVVYPEIFPGNPLEATRYVRWILFNPQDQNVIKKWQTNGDVVYTYDPSFSYGFKEAKKLLVTDLDDGFFYDIGAERNGIIYRTGKGDLHFREFAAHRPEKLDKNLFPILKDLGIRNKVFSKENITRLPDELTRLELRQAFNKSMIFLSYDHASATSLIAALCGCLSVIIPAESFDLERLPQGLRYGVAFGFGEIPRAYLEMKTGMHFYMRQISEESKGTVMKFLRDLL